MIASYLGEKCIDHLIGQSFASVLNKASKKRATEFFTQFTESVEALNKGDDEQEQTISRLLSRLDNSPDDAELLFSAYRQVVFSRSHTLGPRFIAYTTANILCELRAATPDEQCALFAAEQLSDKELVDLATYVLPKFINNRNNIFEILSLSTNLASNKYHDAPGSIDIQDHLGIWAVRAESYGLLRQYSINSSHDYQEDSERHIDEPGTIATTKYYVEIHPSALQLAEGIRKISLGTEYYW